MAKLPHQNPMAHKQIVFLSGLPRTGSTLLTSILSQNPDIHVEGQSALPFLMHGALITCKTEARENLIRTHRADFDKMWLSETAAIYYKDVSKPIIVDKMRGWTKDGSQLRYYLNNEPRIVTMLRPITEIVRSFVRVKKMNNDMLPEANLLTPNSPLMVAIQNVAWALQQDSNEQLFCTYDQLLTNPQSFLDQVCDFWQIRKWQWDFNNITNPKPEDDAAFCTEGLHDVRPKLGKREYEVKVSVTLMAFAKQLDEALWHDYEQAKKIRPGSFIA
jgi:sulfotransferase